MSINQVCSCTNSLQVKKHGHALTRTFVCAFRATPPSFLHLLCASELRTLNHCTADVAIFTCALRWAGPWRPLATMLVGNSVIVTYYKKSTKSHVITLGRLRNWMFGTNLSGIISLTYLCRLNWNYGFFFGSSQMQIRLPSSSRTDAITWTIDN